MWVDEPTLLLLVSSHCEGQANGTTHVMWVCESTQQVAAYRGVATACRPHFCQHETRRRNRTPAPRGSPAFFFLNPFRAPGSTELYVARCL